ncbi:hypothetical protein JB92DRAFT_2837376 [Gautieria morchelliformis]|nr:hypothetical protein JB92DRAFT_2837376 [Gautieria morchelliformis]
MPTSIDERTRLQTLFEQPPASLPDSVQARSCCMHQPSKLSLLREQAADANAAAKAKAKGQKCYKETEDSLEKVVEAVDSPQRDSGCFTESSEEMTTETSSNGDDFVPNAELADLLPRKTIPETHMRLGPQSTPRATASAASSMVRVEGKKHKCRSKKVSQSHHEEEKELNDELPPRNDNGEPTNKKRKPVETEESANDAEIDPMVGHYKYGGYTFTEDEPGPGDRSVRPPIYHFYESVGKNSNGAPGQMGDKHYRCYHGQRKILTVTKKMKGSQNGLVTYLRTHFPEMHRLYETIKSRPEQRPTSKELQIAANKVPIDSKTVQEYLRTLESKKVPYQRRSRVRLQRTRYLGTKTNLSGSWSSGKWHVLSPSMRSKNLNFKRYLSTPTIAQPHCTYLAPLQSGDR